MIYITASKKQLNTPQTQQVQEPNSFGEWEAEMQKMGVNYAVFNQDNLKSSRSFMGGNYKESEGQKKKWNCCKRSKRKTN